jgi:circadian clock protein KaiC
LSYGHAGLDKLFEKGGFFRGTSTLITGSAGTLKTTLASYFALGSCQRKESTLFFSFEESPDQLIRNMKSVGIQLSSFIKSRLLYIHSSRPSLQGLEMHLLVLHKLIQELEPRTVIIDPISSLVTVGNASEVRAMLVRLMDMLKINQINALFTSLTHEKSNEYNDLTVDAVSSLADTWIKVSNTEKNAALERALNIVKSRGMGHSKGIWEFAVYDKGIKLIKPV